MDEEFQKQILEAAASAGPFQVKPYWNNEGKQIEVLFENVEHYGDWLNHSVTLFRAMDNNRVVGCIISQPGTCDFRVCQDCQRAAVHEQIREENLCWDCREKNLPPISERLRELAELSGDTWNGIDPEEWVREQRADD